MGSFLTGATGTGNSFSAQSAPIHQQNFQQGLSDSTTQFNRAFQGQNEFGTLLQNQMQGIGPNPAQLQFNKNTQDAIKQNAGFIASQKGINPALAARMAADNAANMSQGAAGQSAMMQAQQQLGAQNSYGQLLGQQAGESLGMNQNLQQSQASQNNAIVGNTSQMNQANGAVSAQNAQQSANLFGQAAGGLAAGAMSFLNKGGQVPTQGDLKRAMQANHAPVQHFDYGGPVLNVSGMPTNYGNFGQSPQQAQNSFSSGMNLGNALVNAFSGGNKGISDDQAQESYLDADRQLGVSGVDNKEEMLPATGTMAMPAEGTQFAAQGGLIHTAETIAPYAIAFLNKGGRVPMHVGAIYYPEKYCNGGGVGMLANQGGGVPGKANVPGKNTPKNDTVPAMLSPGEIVIPLSVVNSDDPAKNAAKFVAEKLREKSAKGNENGDFKEALKKAIGSRKS